MPDPARLEIIIREDGSATRTEPVASAPSPQPSSQPQPSNQPRSRPQQPRTRTEPPPTEVPATPPPPSALSGFGNIAQRGAGLFGPDVLNVAIARFSAVAGLFGDAQKQFQENLQRQRDVVKQQVDNVRNQMDTLRERRRQDPRLSGNVPPPPTRLPVAVSTPRIRQQKVAFEQESKRLMQRLITRMDRLTARIDSMFRAAQQRAQQVRPFTQVPPSSRIIDVQPRRLSGPEGREGQPGLIPRVNAPVPAAPRRLPQLPSVPPAPRAGLPAIPRVPPAPVVAPAALAGGVAAAAAAALGPIGIAVAAVAATMAAMALVVAKVTAVFREMSGELEEISPDIQIARANQEVTRLFGNLRREDRASEDLAQFIRLQTDAGELMRDIKTDIVNFSAEFIPLAQSTIELLRETRNIGIDIFSEMVLFFIWVRTAGDKNIVDMVKLGLQVAKDIRDKQDKKDEDLDADELDALLKGLLGGGGDLPFNVDQPLENQPVVPFQGFVPQAGKFFNGP